MLEDKDVEKMSESELRKLVVAQSRKLQELSDRVKRLEEAMKRPGIVVPPTAPYSTVPAPGAPLPKGWYEREFNGMKYYIVLVDPANSPDQGSAPKGRQTQPSATTSGQRP
jgi:hypothetical protein